MNQNSTVLPLVKYQTLAHIDPQLHTLAELLAGFFSHYDLFKWEGELPEPYQEMFKKGTVMVDELWVQHHNPDTGEKHNLVVRYADRSRVAGPGEETKPAPNGNGFYENLNF